MPSEEREGGEGGSGIVPELRLLWSLAWPSGLSMVLRMGTMQTTMIVVGHMGTEGWRPWRWGTCGSRWSG